MNIKPNIIMACIQPYWSCLQLGSQHLARQFAAHGFEVHYLSSPVTPLHLGRLTSAETMKRFKNALNNPWTDPANNIRSYIPFSLIAPDGLPLLKEQPVTMHWQKTVLPGPSLFIKKNNLNKINVLYIDNLSYHFLLDYVDYEKCVFRVMDRHDGFPGWKDKTEVMACKIAERADLTIYSAMGLKDYVESLNPQRSVLIANGVDYDHFQNKDDQIRHPLLASIPDPIILYTGSIDSRFHTELVMNTANRLPEVSFVCVGPTPGTSLSSNSPGNVYFPGPADHRDLPQLMNSAHAGIIPFDTENKSNLINGIRPLKLLEYMAAGLPVICARWPEIELLNRPACLYDNEEEFTRLVWKAVSQPHDPDPYRAFARQNTWEKSFQVMIKELKSK